MNGKLNSPQNRFIALFLGLFLLFYYFNIGFWSLVSPTGKHYNAYLAEHFNYIGGMRSLLVKLTVSSLRSLGYNALNNSDQVLVPGRGLIIIAYDCIGMGVISFFSAFAMAYPRSIRTRLIFLILGIVTIQILNVCRLVILTLYWSKARPRMVDHHLIFNVIIYTLIGISIYFYTRQQTPNTGHAKN